jgi:YD repeat-containing protein
MKLYQSLRILMGLLCILWSTSSMAQESLCYNERWSIPAERKGLCAPPIVHDLVYKTATWYVDPGPRVFASESDIIAFLSGVYGCPTSLPAFGINYDWNFGISKHWNSIYLSCGSSSGYVAENISAYRPWTCPAGFGQYVGASPGAPVTPSSIAGFPCFKPNAKVYGGCTAGDPIKIFDNSVVETEVDYQAGTNPLNIMRFYRSYGAATTLAIGTNWNGSFGGNVQDALYSQPYAAVLKPNGEYQTFSSVGSGLWAAPNFDSDKLIELTGSGGARAGWRYYGMSDRVIREFSAIGALQVEYFADGRRVTYLYSDVNTPLTVAPLPGLLISMSDTFGRGLLLKYDQSTYLIGVNDPAGGTIAYTYESAPASQGIRDLKSVTYQDGTQRLYSYLVPASSFVVGSNVKNNSLLTSLIDELGNTYASFSYLTNGARPYAISSEQANGIYRHSFDVFNPTLGRSVVTDALGTRRTYNSMLTVGGEQQKYVDAGRDQPGGSGCAASSQSTVTDNNGNLWRRDEFNGARSCYLSDLGRNLETTRVEGLSAAIACPSVTSANAALPVGSRKVSTTWHPDWRLEVRVAEPLKLTTSVYNGQPDPFNGNTIATCAPGSAVLPDGKPIVVLCKRVEQATTDADGRLGLGATLQAGIASRVSSWTYNQYGQMLTAKGPRTDVNDSTTFAYFTDTTPDHTQGDLQSVTNALGRITSFTKYNKHGQVLEMSDANGVLTVNTYDQRQRLLSTNAGGLQTTNTYDAAGQLKTVTRPDSSIVTYTYDAAHRLVATTDGAGNTTSYTLDGAGNRVAEQITNAAQQVTRTVNRRFDALGRLESITGAPN